MSKNYDNWERLVGAVLRREKDRELAFFQSFSSFSSVDVSSTASFASDVPAAIRFEEIKLATKNFHPDTLLGEGRFGPVFKGWIHEDFLTAVKPGSGMPVAIRKLNEGEIFCLALPHHPNLVKLIGYSFEEGNRILVYEFVPNGSLDNHLFTRAHQLLSWETRVKVAIGAARGLSFFHAFSITVSHQGVKSSSILLDDEYIANFSDFDLVPSRISASLLNDYAAPEYTAGCQTMQSDVYSFGIILLELFSGLRVCDKNRPTEEQNLVVWAKPYLHNMEKLLQIVDSRFEGQYPRCGAYEIWKLVFQCLSLNPKLRPRMTEVVDSLEQLSSPLSAGPHYRYDLAEPDTDFVVTFDPSHESISLLRNAVPMNFNEIQKATDNFRPNLLLEEGSSVYKGMILEHPNTAEKPERVIPVAVKKLNKKELPLGGKECLAGINYWRQLRHPNLVKLIGYCFDADNRILVYEYIPHGSLSNHLFSEGLQPLPWEIRLKVALCVGRALLYLHVVMRYLHGAFDSDDILLDTVYNAKLSYCFLPRVASTRFLKFSYELPDYLATGELVAKCDVYRFGAVLLELLTGRRAYDINRPTGQQNLVPWAIPYLGSKKLRIMDARLAGQYSDGAAYEVAKLALKCLSYCPRSRPSMADVVVTLQHLQCP